MVPVPTGYMTRNGGDSGSDGDTNEEERRLAYLRRHRAMLEQKQRLEIERRVDEASLDKASIARRQEEVAKELQRRKETAVPVSTSLPSLDRRREATDAVNIGVYTKVDTISPSALRLIAEKQALDEMASIDRGGKYHVRFMKNAYPIAGTQLKLEKERDMIIQAKKRLLLGTTEASTTQHEAPSRQRGGFAQLSYRNLDFNMDKYAAILRREESQLTEAEDHRHVRFVDITHRDGLEQFWGLMHTHRYHEVVAWLKAHRFCDVNVPVILRTSQNGALGAVELNRDVGRTPLMAACHLRNVGLVAALVDQGAAVYLTTANSDSAMHFLWRDWDNGTLTTLKSAADAFARAERAHRILMLLIDHKANVNAQNCQGETALHSCSRLGLVDCVKLLLSHGATPHTVDRSGVSPISAARLMQHDEIVRLLQSHEMIERTRRKEMKRHYELSLLKRGRGSLAATWSNPPDKLLARLAVEDRRAGHLRNQFIDRRGCVIVSEDDEGEETSLAT